MAVDALLRAQRFQTLLLVLHLAALSPLCTANTSFVPIYVGSVIFSDANNNVQINLTDRRTRGHLRH